MHDVEVIFPSSRHECSPSLLVLRIHIASKLQQQLYNPDMILLNCFEQRRNPATWRAVGFRTTLEQVFRDVYVAALGCAHQTYA